MKLASPPVLKFLRPGRRAGDVVIGGAPPPTTLGFDGVQVPVDCNFRRPPINSMARLDRGWHISPSDDSCFFSASFSGVIPGTDVPAMVERAIELIGGLRKLQLTGTRTLLKPNVVGGRAPPITTDPCVV